MEKYKLTCAKTGAHSDIPLLLQQSGLRQALFSLQRLLNYRLLNNPSQPKGRLRPQENCLCSSRDSGKVKTSLVLCPSLQQKQQQQKK